VGGDAPFLLGGTGFVAALGTASPVGEARA
jgi:hypothetical protein